MVYIIENGCIGCGSCESVCPTGAIVFGDDKYAIEKSVCAGCGTCESVCPISVIKEHGK